jgi:hypothetical protein
VAAAVEIATDAPEADGASAGNTHLTDNPFAPIYCCELSNRAYRFV